jgi:hypothetical protein
MRAPWVVLGFDTLRSFWGVDVGPGRLVSRLRTFRAPGVRWAEAIDIGDLLSHGRLTHVDLSGAPFDCESLSPSWPAGRSRLTCCAGEQIDRLLDLNPFMEVRAAEQAAPATLISSRQSITLTGCRAVPVQERRRYFEVCAVCVRSGMCLTQLLQFYEQRKKHELTYW